MIIPFERAHSGDPFDVFKSTNLSLTFFFSTPKPAFLGSKVTFTSPTSLTALPLLRPPVWGGTERLGTRLGSFLVRTAERKSFRSRSSQILVMIRARAGKEGVANSSKSLKLD